MNRSNHSKKLVPDENFGLFSIYTVIKIPAVIVCLIFSDRASTFSRFMMMNRKNIFSKILKFCDFRIFEFCGFRDFSKNYFLIQDFSSENIFFSTHISCFSAINDRKSWCPMNNFSRLWCRKACGSVLFTKNRSGINFFESATSLLAIMFNSMYHSTADDEWRNC